MYLKLNFPHPKSTTLPQSSTEVKYLRRHAVGWRMESHAKTATVPTLGSKKGLKGQLFTAAGGSNMSALAERTMNTGHEVDWPSATVLDLYQTCYQSHT